MEGRPVSVDLPPDLPLVQVDGLLLEQVFFNLLENAAKYTPAGTPVTVRAWTSPGWVEVEVADRGPGLPAGEEGRVFDKFVRLSRGRPGRRPRPHDLPRDRRRARRHDLGGEPPRRRGGVPLPAALGDAAPGLSPRRRTTRGTSP